MAQRLTGRQRIALIALVLAVAAAHVGLTGAVAERMADLSSEAAMPPRIEVAYVRDMALAAPPPAAPAAPVAAAPAVSKKAPRAAKAASAPASSAASAPAEVVVEAPPEPASAPASEVAQAEAEPSVPEAAASASALASMAAAEAAPAASAAASAPPFEWPASTRISYALTGNYRGEIAGEAQVEWVHAGPRYQVHLDIVVGAPFAPLLTRRMSSDGEITPQGLRPTRFDQDSKIAFRDRQRLTMHFEPEAVVLANGDRRERLPGLQDTASQFVQMTYLFATTPGLLTVGGTVQFPLALPRKVDRWVYDVVGEEPVYTPFGTLDTFHLVPRPPPTPAGVLTAEIWFAPQLRYLPVRIRIRQDEQTFIDLVISRRPQLAAAP